MKAPKTLQALIMLNIPLLKRGCGMPTGNGVSRNALTHNTARLNNAALAYGNASKNYNVVAKPDIVPDNYILIDHAIAVRYRVVVVVVVKRSDDLAAWP